VRELLNVIRRSSIWSSGTTITEADMVEALRSLPGRGNRNSLEAIRPISEGIDLQRLVQEIKRHYIEEALRESDGNKTKAAKLVGLPNCQTLTADKR
jgi:DNA-binding NtrC family response regulator